MSKEEKLKKEIFNFENKYNSKLKKIKMNNRTKEILQKQLVNIEMGNIEIDNKYIDNIIIIQLERPGIELKLVETLL